MNHLSRRTFIKTAASLLVIIKQKPSPFINTVNGKRKSGTSFKSSCGCAFLPVIRHLPATHSVCHGLWTTDYHPHKYDDTRNKIR